MVRDDTEGAPTAAEVSAIPEAPPIPKKPPKKRLHFGRFLLWLALLPLLLIVLLLGLLAWVLATESGLQAALALAQPLLPGLSYERISGRFIGPLYVEQLRYVDGELHLALQQGMLDWQPRALLEQQLDITQLRLQGLQLQLPPSSEEASATAEPLTLPAIKLPLALRLGEVQVAELRIQPADAPLIAIDKIQLRASAEQQQVEITQLEVEAPQGSVRLHGSLQPSGAYPLHLNLSWQLPTPEYGRFDGQGTLQGALLEELRITQQVQGAAQVELEATLRQLFSAPAWTAQLKLKAPDLRPFAADLAGVPLNAELQAAGGLAKFHAQAQAHTTLPQVGATQLQLKLDGDPEGLQVEQLQITSPKHPLRLDAHGALHFATLRFQVDGNWQALRWPLTGTPQVESASGKLNVEGQSSDYRFQLQAEVQGPDLPKGRWELSGHGSEQAVRGVAFKGTTLDGVIQGTAEVAWLPQVSWQAALDAQGLNPARQWQDLPGKLNLRLNSAGSLENQQLRANLLLEEVSGNVRGQALRGNADLSIHNQDLNIRSLRLHAGANRIEASGSLAQRWELRWAVDAPQLQTLLPGGSGALTSTGTLSGTRERPQVAATFNMRNLRYAAHQVQQLSGSAQIDLGGAARSQLQIDGQGLTLGGETWRNLRVNAAGTPAAHQLQAELHGTLGKFALALTGQLQLPQLRWQGRITQLSAADTVAGNWKLAEASVLQASAQEAQLANTCLSSTPTRICLQGQWSAAQGASGRLQLTNLSAQRFQSFLPKGVELVTALDAEANGSFKPNGALQGQLRLNLAPGSMSMLSAGRKVRFTINGGRLQADSDGRSANANAQLDLGATGNAQAQVRVQDLRGAARLDGKVNLAINDLSMVSLFAPQAQQVAGQIRADVNLLGTPDKLTLRGAVRLENGQVALPEFGINLQEVQLTAASDGRGPLQLDGSLRSKPGMLRISGEVNPLQPSAKVQIKGENFQALDTKDMRIQISPDLSITFAQQQLRIDGKVRIPKAFIRPAGGGQGAVRASSDVVIVQKRDAAPPPPSSGMALFAKVLVILGEEVLLETPVFKGRLAGQLLVEESPQLAPRGSGIVEVVAGNYKIFGQELEIQRGQVLFSNSPLDNPGLDLRVVRSLASSNAANNFGEASMVGAQVRGTLRQPKLTLFSQPKMPDSEILSHLLLGRGGGSGAETALLFKAANALGFGSDALAGGISSSLGLDELQFNPDGGGNGSALSLGKYLTPDLYVGYGVGLLDNANIFIMRYRLTRNLAFESNTSAAGTGADITYSIEY